MFRTLLYRSHATRELDERDLLPILMASMRNNVRVGVTGLLLYGPPEPLPKPAADTPPASTVVPFEGPGVFAQWLEGPEEAVEEAYRRIEQDVRHDRIEILDAGTSDRRLFPYWSMALETVRALPETVGAIFELAETHRDESRSDLC